MCEDIYMDILVLKKGYDMVKKNEIMSNNLSYYKTFWNMLKFSSNYYYLHSKL